MSKTIDVLFPKAGDNIGHPSWSDSPLRIVSVEPISFPDDFCSCADELLRQCEIVRSFVEACTLSLELVHGIEQALYALELYVVRQYYVVVCRRFYEWAMERQRNFDAKPEAERALRLLDAALGTLRAVLEKFWRAEELDAQQARCVAERWLVMTIFHPVFAALASTFDLATADAANALAFEQHVRRTAVGRAWFDKTRALRPSAILMNFTDGMIGTSAARWQTGARRGKHTFSRFERWDKQVRAAGIAEEAHRLFAATREALLPLSVHHEPRSTRRWSETQAAGVAAL